MQLQILSLNFKTQGAYQLQRKNAPSLIIKEMSRCRPNYFRVGFGFNLQLFYFQRGYHIIFFGGLPPLCVSCQRSMGGTALFWHHHQWHGHRLGVVLSWAAGGFSFLTNRLWGPLSIKAFLKMDPDLSQERSPHPSKSSLDQIGTQQCLSISHHGA